MTPSSFFSSRPFLNKQFLLFFFAAAPAVLNLFFSMLYDEDHYYCGDDGLLRILYDDLNIIQKNNNNVRTNMR